MQTEITRYHRTVTQLIPRYRGRWLVPASSGKAAYQIDAAARTCTCPDYQHRGVRCKHRLSVSVALLLERAEVEALDPTPLPIAGGADDADWQEQAPQGAPVQADAPIPLELTARGLLAVLLPGAAVAPLGVRRG
jgi:hypothetical protein